MSAFWFRQNRCFGRYFRPECRISEQNISVLPKLGRTLRQIFSFSLHIDVGRRHQGSDDTKHLQTDRQSPLLLLFAPPQNATVVGTRRASERHLEHLSFALSAPWRLLPPAMPGSRWGLQELREFCVFILDRGRRHRLPRLFSFVSFPLSWEATTKRGRKTRTMQGGRSPRRPRFCCF